MKIDNLAMPPFSTTLLGVVKGVADHFGIGCSTSMLYGGSGHAFLMNVHPTLCPSGPYCWKLEGFLLLLRNLGIEMTCHGFFHGGSTAEERSAIESKLKGLLDSGVPCSLLNMEHQLITGCDDQGFFTAQPWPGMDFPPGRLSFGTWEELKDEIHMSFFSFAKVPAAEETTAIDASLAYAVDLYDHPRRHTEEGYDVGNGGYDNWIKAVRGGHGAGHGSWWNGMVWSECRGRAAEYFAEIAQKHPRLAPAARDCAAAYADIAASLMQAGDKTLEPDRKLEVLAYARDKEAGCIAAIRTMRARA